MAPTAPSLAGLDERDVHVIASPEALRLLAHPLRLRILEALRAGGDEPRTVKQLAAALDVPQTKLYYHVNLLEEHGLVAVAETRLVSGITEKRYRVTAYRLSVDKAMLGATAEGGDALDVYLSLVLDEARSEIKRAVAHGLIDVDRTHEDRIRPGLLVLGRKWLWLTPAQVEDFDSRFAALCDEFAPVEVGRGAAFGNEMPAGQLYEFLIGFYPTVPPGDPASDRNVDS